MGGKNRVRSRKAKPEEAHRSPMESESFPWPAFLIEGKRGPSSLSYLLIGTFLPLMQIEKKQVNS